MRARTLGRGVVGLVTAGLLLTTAACGGGADASSTTGAAGSSGQSTDKVTVAIGGQTALIYLPVVLTQQLGYFKDAGVDVNLVNFNGGSKAIEAMLGSSADVAASSYDHTIQLQTKGQKAEAFVNYGVVPSVSLVVSPKDAGQIKTVADLKGKPVGVSAPGSSTEFFLDRALSKVGLDKSAVSIVGIGVGTTAVAQMEQGSVVAGVVTEPDLSVIKQFAGGSLTILANGMTKSGTQQVVGSDSYDSGSLLAQPSWLQSHQQAAKKMAQAIVRTLDWIRGHSAEEIAAKMPASFAGGHPDIYTQAIQNSKEGFDTDGTFSDAGTQAVLSLLKDGGVVSGPVDLSATYTNSYVK